MAPSKLIRPMGIENFSSRTQKNIAAAQKNSKLIRLDSNAKANDIETRVLNMIGQGSVYLTQKRYSIFKFTR